MTVSRHHGLRAGDTVVLRTPMLPMTAFVEWATTGDAAAARRYMAGLLELPEVREALFVASPSLSSAVEAWYAAPTSSSGQRVEQALVKYLARMMGRATPFGLCSGVSIGRLGRETKLALAPRTEYRRRTRLDNDYLFVLAGELAKSPEVRHTLRYRPNTSCYRVVGQLRYAAGALDGTVRRYQLVSVERTPYLDATLERAAHGATRAELAAPLVDGSVTLTEAHAYIDELIDAQLLMPELGIHVTGPEPLQGMAAQLRAAGLATAEAVLDDVRGRLAALDATAIGDSRNHYDAIASALEPLPAKTDLSRLFQVDMVKPAAATVGNRVAADLAHGIEQLARIRRDRPSFDEWKRAFRARWDDRAMPLLEVLDEESGIGFESGTGPGTAGAPLLVGLPFPPGPPDGRASWTKFERHMLKRLAGALAGGVDEIVLDERDLSAMELPTAAELPDAFAALVRLAATTAELGRGEVTLMLEGCSGPSGAKLLGRFCHASTELEAMVRAHHAVEEARRPHAVFAEIVHLNEGRIGNILCRPVLRDHEIVYLGISGAPASRQILLDDLLVAVRHDRIVLLSRRLGCEVVPRLTTAHNYKLRSLAPYRFLCALAEQDLDIPRWSWGALAAAPFLPRVRIGRVVVARAIWNLERAELAPITAAVRAASRDPARNADVGAAVAELRGRRKLPRVFVIADGDHELPIDLDNPLLAAAFADEVAGVDRAQLTELFPAPDHLVVDGPEGAFANELVVTFTRQREPERPFATTPVSTIRRELPPGSEWLFAKIYCGEATADRVLRDIVGPMARGAIASGDVSQWFFVRYADPDPHLRVRFRGDPQRLCGRVLPALSHALAAGPAGKLVLDTYVRETERYGGDRGIELVEELFWRDSEAALEIVETFDGDSGAVARWKLCLRGIDSLLDILGLDAETRAKVVTDGRNSIGRELRADTELWRKIGERFTRERDDLELLLARDRTRHVGHPLERGCEILERRDAACAELCAELRRRDRCGELDPRLADVAWSIVHMHANRLLRGSPRAQELVLYDFIRRLYAARRVRGERWPSDRCLQSETVE